MQKYCNEHRNKSTTENQEEIRVFLKSKNPYRFKEKEFGIWD